MEEKENNEWKERYFKVLLRGTCMGQDIEDVLSLILIDF